MQLFKRTEVYNIMTKSKVISGVLEYRQFIVLEDGTDVRVRYNQNPALYEGTDVQVYSYTAKEGKGEDAKEVTRYAVPFNDAIRAKRATTRDSIASLQAQGLSADEILLLLMK